MGKYKEIEGDLVKLALEGSFEVIAQGNNCFCVQGAGIAPQMSKAFGCDKFPKEHQSQKGNIDKLGTIDYMLGKDGLYIINAYTQYNYGKNHSDGVAKPLDYEALIMCMRKINHIFKGKHIGLPQIGCGLAGGDWNRVKQILLQELIDCDLTVVIYKP